jgi:2-oxoglutarate dehydrogenase complex dehydrogenase (E1) component-like enzyme
MTPKSLLRHKMAISTLKELTHGAFKPILADTTDKNK